MKYILVILFGTCLATCVEAQKKTSDAKTISKKQLKGWIVQLSEGSFRERRSASNNLLNAGKQALPILVNSTQKKNTELATRCVEIVASMYRGKDKTLRDAAKKILNELEKSSDPKIAQRAKDALRPGSLEADIDAISDLGGRIYVDKSGKVERVNLANTRITDSDLVHLKSMTKLIILDLDNTQINGSGFVHLKGLSNLKKLVLNTATQLNDADLRHLKGHTNLKWLDLCNTKITDVGLNHLKGLTGLKYLFLYKTKISNAGLVHLKGLHNLKTLKVHATKVTGEGVEELRSALRKCHISWPKPLADRK